MSHVTAFGSYKDRVKRAWKFRFNRPNHDLGLYWGLVFRLAVGLLSGLSALLFVLALGLVSGFEFGAPHIVSIGIVFGLMTLLGEYYRSRLFEAARQSENETVEVTLSSSAIYVDGKSAFDGARRSNPLFGRVLKRTLDIVLAVLALLALAPLMLIVALVIRSTSGGPALFKSERQGLNGHRFRVLKFRSMRIDTGATSAALAPEERITPVGRLIRRTSIDELPQLLNILRGDMSIVGHRPMSGHAEVTPPFDPKSPGSKPGLVSLSASLGLRAYNPDQQRQIGQIEQLYVEKWSILSDFRIIGRVLVRELWHTTD